MLLVPIILLIFALTCFVLAVIFIMKYRKTRTIRYLVLFIVLLILGFNIGLAGIRYSIPSQQYIGQPQDVSHLDPQHLVQTYYKSLAAGGYVTAKACLSDEIDGNFSIQQYTNLTDSDFTNIRVLSNIRVSPPYPIRLDNLNYAEVQVTVEYFALYKKVITSQNGEQIRFVYVAKKEKDSPWKIISIGTGP